MDKKELKELKKAFKKVINPFFMLCNEQISFGWGENDGIPYDKIFIGKRGMPHPDYTLSPYDIERLEYDKPGLFKPGMLKVIGTDGKIIWADIFKDKMNIKQVDKFNECLRLYKQYNLGK